MIWLFSHDKITAYRDVWCPEEMRLSDPETCTAGLAIGYVWFPALLLLMGATFIYLVSRVCRALRNRRR